MLTVALYSYRYHRNRYSVHEILYHTARQGTHRTVISNVSASIMNEQRFSSGGLALIYGFTTGNWYNLRNSNNFSICPKLLVKL